MTDLLQNDGSMLSGVELAVVFDANGEKQRIGIIAGGGRLPAAVARAAHDQEHQVFLVGLTGNADPSVEQFPHAYVHLGQLGRMLRTLRGEKCRSIVLVGSVRRPNLWRVKADLGFIRRLPRLVRILRGGDDAVLRKVGRFFEAEGFRVLAAHEIAPELLAPGGSFSRAVPTAEATHDIETGVALLAALGPFDVGQAVVVRDGYVLAVEAAEGTDAMLARCASLPAARRKGRRGVLIKAPKPGQDLRFDLPTIGPRTVALVADAGLAGIAVTAGRVLIADQEQLVDKADREGIFLIGAAAGKS